MLISIFTQNKKGRHTMLTEPFSRTPVYLLRLCLLAAVIAGSAFSNHSAPAALADANNPVTASAPVANFFSDPITGVASHSSAEDLSGPWIMMAGTPWRERADHTSVTLPDGSIVIMGGDRGYAYSYGESRNDVWRSTDMGATWTEMTLGAEWATRLGHTSVVLPDGSIVLMGGRGYQFPGVLTYNDVWRSTDQGATWTQMTANAEWHSRYGHTSVVLPDGSIVLMGGYYYTGTNYTLNDVWRSTDMGATWTQMTASAEGGERQNHTSVVLTDGSIVLMGGYKINSVGGYADVWRSTDMGATWTQMTASAEWGGRSDHTSVALADGSIILMGGFDSNNVWRSTDQGATWTQMTASAEWGRRDGHTSVVLPDESIVLVGGVGDEGNWFDAWRSTDQGATWTIMAGTPWAARESHTSVALPDGSIILMGGETEGNSLNDVWRSIDMGATWTQQTKYAEWSHRYGHTSLVMADGSIVLMGGRVASSIFKNDVWRSTDQGATWTQMTAAAPWTARFDHTSVLLPDGSIVLMGGADGITSGDNLNDVWRSTDQGATWTQMTASAPWAERQDHTSVALPDGSIVLMGGFYYNNGFKYLNDVWRSTDKGITWTQMTAGAEWGVAGDHTSVVLADGSIVLMGGRGSTSSYSDNVWRSTDQGATWTQLTDSAEWWARYAHTSVVLPDSSIVLMGGSNLSNLHDVWRLETNISSTHTIYLPLVVRTP
jgi:hypothetical protein